ncbi:MAG: hypothetical protein BZY87_04085 [SAR202 cluster bacterium Io17-Chloro-G6]|nr:MAG: hypothetical protein BZY87_04085 [SAR202 cluster bacterium Io17-Chloro-G6]
MTGAEDWAKGSTLTEPLVGSKKLRILILAAALCLIVLGCTGPTFNRAIHDPVTSTEELQTQLARLEQVNLTVAGGKFDLGRYPALVGIDIRNGNTLVEKFICWDGCPELGQVFLVYQGVGSKEACLNTEGSPIISPVPIPGESWGCVLIID